MGCGERSFSLVICHLSSALSATHLVHCPVAVTASWGNQLILDYWPTTTPQQGSKNKTHLTHDQHGLVWHSLHLISQTSPGQLLIENDIIGFDIMPLMVCLLELKLETRSHFGYKSSLGYNYHALRHEALMSQQLVRFSHADGPHDNIIPHFCLPLFFFFLCDNGWCYSPSSTLSVVAQPFPSLRHHQYPNPQLIFTYSQQPDWPGALPQTHPLFISWFTTQLRPNMEDVALRWQTSEFPIKQFGTLPVCLDSHILLASLSY